MSESVLRALVVDDEVVSRRMVMFALTSEGFHCDPAYDGQDASQKASQANYDLVITDLRMPKKHGHALAMELIGDNGGASPIVVIHTSIDDPRLTKDLLLRGVEDVVYKPVNYPAFAAKMKALVLRRRQKRGGGLTTAVSPSTTAAGASPARPAPAEVTAAIRIEEFDERLVQIASILPVSNVATEVVERVRQDEIDCRTLAQVIERDGVLAAELLRLANSPMYNRMGRHVVDLHEAVARVGVKRIGEISLAVAALSGLTSSVLPWFDKDLAWQRSLAAGLAAHRILERCRGLSAPGIVFSALMYPLSRVVLGMAYPEIYQKLIAECHRSNRSLREVERPVFPRTPAASIAQVLSRWQLPAEVSVPLIHADLPLASLAGLAEPVRSNVKALKVATLLGEFAVGRWMGWDLIDLPRSTMLRELAVNAPGDMIAAIRDDLAAVLATSSAAPPRETGQPRPHEGNSKPLAYRDLSGDTFDFIAPLLESMGFELTETPDDHDRPLVVSAMAGSVTQWATVAGAGGRHPATVTITQAKREPFSANETLVQLPASYAAIQAACQRKIESPVAPLNNLHAGDVGSVDTSRLVF